MKKVFLSSVLLLVISCALSAEDATSLDLLAGRKWMFSFDKDKKGVADKWFAPEFNDSSWKEIKVPASWSSLGMPYMGDAWYRLSFDIPTSWKGDNLFIKLPCIDDADESYFNGKKIGATSNQHFNEQRVYKIDKELVRAGEKNVLAVKVSNNYMDGGIFKGEAKIARYGEFRQIPQQQSEPMKLDFMTSDASLSRLFDKESWKYGCRDEGTADTRPKLSAQKVVFNGKNALGVEIWYPNSSMEFIDYKLPASANGDVWKQNNYRYLSFYYKSKEAEGEIKVGLSFGNWSWTSKGTNYHATVFVKPGEWTKVVVPFSQFSTGIKKDFKTLDSLAGLNTFHIGYRGNELKKGGEILFADFAVGPYSCSSEASGISLEGVWLFNKDEDDVGLKEGWEKPDFNDSSWVHLWASDNWEKEKEFSKYDGVGWYRAKVFIPESWKKLPIDINLGKTDDTGELFFNGTPIAKTEKIGQVLCGQIPAEMVRPGALNTIAVRIFDKAQGGGFDGGLFEMAPVFSGVYVCNAGTSSGTPAVPEKFDMGTKPGQIYDIVFKVPSMVTADKKLKVDYVLIDYFHRKLKEGSIDLGNEKDGMLSAVVSLSKEESRQLFYSEKFDYSVQIRDSKDGLVIADAGLRRQLCYESRDNLSLPALAEKFEDTPYGKLKLVDEIDCSVDPSQDEHPYKEGGISESWVGRKAYCTWVKGVTVEEFQGRKYRQADNNEWFGYRVGRGKITPHGAYILRIEYPEDKTRYVPMSIEAGRNYQGTGFKTGAGPDDPIDNYPLSGKYEWYDNLVFPDEKDYGYLGNRKTTTEHGFWFFMMAPSRIYVPHYQSGPAAARVKLYEIKDVEKYYPKINLPEGMPQRVLMADWERQPEAFPEDVMKHAKFIGLNMISPVIQKWASMAFWPTKLGFRQEDPLFPFIGLPEGQTAKTWDEFLAASAKVGIKIMPRVEYGGSSTLPKEAIAIGPDGNKSGVGRFATWGANLLNPATWDEFSTIIDELVTEKIKDNPQISGMLWRMRNDRMVISYGEEDVKLFCKETGTKLPDFEKDEPEPEAKADAKAKDAKKAPAAKKKKEKGPANPYSEWAAKGEIAKRYQDWWHKKRLEFHKKIIAKLQAIRPDLKLFYYNWDEDGWNLGLSNNATNKPQDWTDMYDVNKSAEFHGKRSELRKQYKDADYLDMLKKMPLQHDKVQMELYRNVKGMVFFAPIHWRYLADNDPYINYFQTGDGLAMCNMYNYEEKQRWNVQGHNHESCEMTPAGPAFSMAEEVLCCFHGDPDVITCTTYTYGRGFIDAHRRFAQAFLALPATKGTVVKNENPDVKVRTYPSRNGTYVGVVYKGYRPAKFAVSIPGDWKGAETVTDLVSGKPMQAQLKDGSLVFDVDAGPMELDSYLVK
ncbi:MAG: hypothetical protein A2X48_19180 [Lentisphaerae bacterium GWF2_49_21]|nr:MAG: hypothetical protein A2X48_19180 [Lentisphaerae bacterium GWF2_49_21]